MSESSSFDRLSYGVQRWIYRQGWDALRAVQEKATPVILDAMEDILITAPTAGGKTEAAFMPVISWLENDGPEAGYGVLCLSPLKALINDQYFRLTPLCEQASTAITPWHGDVSSSAKRRSWSAPSGILMTTPESLEAMFVTRSHELQARMANLKYVVIDEFHAFIGRDRGQQLISLLARLEDLIGQPLCRIALSATIGDPLVALRYLRPDNSRQGVHLDVSHESLDLQLSLKAYVKNEKADLPAIFQMARELFEQLRGSSHLVFANSRKTVEEMTDLLTSLCEGASLPVEFFAHHGSLSRDVRYFVEQRLKDGNKPTTAIATSTLELGIDIGDVTSVAQIGAPANVCSVRQRLGRSGRREGQSAIMRLLITSRSQDPKASPVELLEIELFQAIAVVELMFERWIEPPDEHALHLSTMVQQILSMIAFKGGITAAKAYRILCKKGPWTQVSPEFFGEVLRSLGENQVITQLSNGELIVGSVGERIVSRYTFYTAFEVPEEYRLIGNGKLIGTLPVTTPYIEKQLLIFGGKRWSVESVDADSKTITLVRARSGAAPLFGGEAASVHRKIRQRMLELYQNNVEPRYCDDRTIALMAGARDYFRDNDIAKKPFVRDGESSYWFLWEDDRVIDTIKVCSTLTGIPAGIWGPCVIIGSPIAYESLTVQLNQYLEKHSEADISSMVSSEPLGKFDVHLGPALIKKSFVAEKLDIGGAAALLQLVTDE